MSYHSRQPSVASSLLSSSTFNNTSQINKIGPWRLGKTLGAGSTGRVLLAEHMSTGQRAAVKVVSKSVLNSMEQSDDKGRDAAGLAYGIEREIIIMKLLNHPNVLRLYDVWETSKSLYLILEYVEGGELFDLLVERGPLSEDEAVRYFRQIMMGASYCHALGICHRDLKPENLLLDHNLNVKLADFGMAALENNDRLLETSCGSPHYAAPEIVSGKHYHGFESDVWSCGVILFALLTGRLPFDDENIRNLLLKVQSGNFDMPSELSPEAQDLIKQMLTVNPDNRISSHKVLEHSLLKKYPISPIDQKTLKELPNPNSYLNQIAKREDIDDSIVQNLVILWHGREKPDIIDNLMKKEPNTEKIFYFLLLRYRHNQSNSSLIRSLSIAKSVNNRNSITASSSASSANKARKNRRSIISVTSAHRKSVSFNNKRRSLTETSPARPSPPSFNNDNQPPVPRLVYDTTIQQHTSNASKRRSVRASLLPNKRSSITTKLIAAYARLAEESDWVYIDKEAKRTSSDFATLCDEIFEHEKYEKIRQEEAREKAELKAKQQEERLEKLQREAEERHLKEQERSRRETEQLEQSEAESQARVEAQAETEAKLAAQFEEDEKMDSAPKIESSKLRSTSGPSRQRASQLLDRDEIMKIQKRATTNPFQTRPKSRLDPGLNFDPQDWRHSRVLYDESDTVTQAIRRSRFLGSRFDLNVKRASTIKKNKELAQRFEYDSSAIQTSSESPVVEQTLKEDEEWDGPKTIADVKIPQVTRKSRMYSNSNKRLSVLSIYSTRASYTDLAAKLRDLNEDSMEETVEQDPIVEEELPLVPEHINTTVATNKASNMRLSFADRLTALSNENIVVEIEDPVDGQQKNIQLPSLPSVNEVKVTTPQPPKHDFAVLEDHEAEQTQQKSLPLPKAPRKELQPKPQNPLGDITNDQNKRNTSGGSFFRKWSRGKKEMAELEQQSSSSFFRIFSGGSKPVTKSMSTVSEPLEIYMTLKRLLSGWSDYGLSNLVADDQHMVITGEVSKNNMMGVSKSKFKLSIDKRGKKGSTVRFDKEKGSSKTFKTLVGEVERIMTRENLLAFSA